MWVHFCDFYYMFLSLWGFKKAERDYKIIEDKTRFLILVAAHNEEAVLESSHKNWKEIDYNKDLFDIIVVNDNSTDGTKDVCEKIGVAHVDTIEGRFPREGVGKPAGIQYALREIGFEQIREKYDLIMILDADNHVDSNILKEVNSQWQEYKPTAIQTYLDSKNPDSSVLSRGYATAYWATNRFFQLAKHRLGLHCSIGGTGFAVSSEWLITNGGFNYKSLTEDLEMEIRIVELGGKVIWNHFTRIYDEKPDELKISIKQRTRWSQGHWFVAFDNIKPLLICMWKDKRNIHKYLDQLLYLFGMGRGIMVVVLLIQTILIIITNYILQGNSFNAEALEIIVAFFFYMIVPITLRRIIITIYAIGIIIVFANNTDGDGKDYLKSIVGVLYLAYTYMFTQVKGLLKWRQQNVWVKTPHKHNVKTNKG